MSNNQNESEKMNLFKFCEKKRSIFRDNSTFLIDFFADIRDMSIKL